MRSRHARWHLSSGSVGRPGKVVVLRRVVVVVVVVLARVVPVRDVVVTELVEVEADVVVVEVVVVTEVQPRHARNAARRAFGPLIRHPAAHVVDSNASWRAAFKSDRKKLWHLRTHPSSTVHRPGEVAGHVAMQAFRSSRNAASCARRNAQGSCKHASCSQQSGVPRQSWRQAGSAVAVEASRTSEPAASKTARERCRTPPRIVVSIGVVKSNASRSIMRYIRSSVAMPNNPSPSPSVRAVTSQRTRRLSRSAGSAWSTGQAS